MKPAFVGTQRKESLERSISDDSLSLSGVVSPCTPHYSGMINLANSGVQKN